MSPQPAERPLVPGTIHGLRSWLVDERGRRLTGMVHRLAWPRRRPMSAWCIATEGEHEAPAHGCSCGIYAFHPSAEAIKMLHRLVSKGRRGAPVRTQVIGILEAWDRVEVHETGFRAQRARPKALVSFARQPRARRAAIERIASAYGVEVLRVAGPAELSSLMEELGVAGLGEGPVEDMLAPLHEVVLIPGTEAFLEGPNDEPIGGAGYDILGAGRPVRRRSLGGATAIPGTLALRIVGSHYRRAGFQDPAFEPGRPLRLVPDPGNLHDGGAVAVWDEHMRVQAGYVSRRFAGRVGELLRTGRIGDVRSLWQWRSLRSGERTELWLLIARSSMRLDGPEDARACGDNIPF